MSLRRLFLYAAWLCPGLAPALAAPNHAFRFAPAPGVAADVRASSSPSGQTVSTALRRAGHSSTYRIAIGSDKAVRPAAIDYDFDGYVDLSLAHVDDGMDAYAIYDIWLYAPRPHRLVQHVPNCGDASINIQLASGP